MKLSCEIIQDLLPLYVDGVCSKESMRLVEQHLAECDDCRACRDAMDAKMQNTEGETEEMKLTNGLKKLKSRIGKRTRIAILISAAAVLAAAAMGERLFNAPLKRLGPEDFQVSAQVYSVDELPAGVCYSAGENSVEITKSEDDAGKLFMVQLPSFPEAEIMLSENVIESTEYISVIQWQSPYHLLMIQYDDGGSGGDTLYVRSVKTTLLNNSAPQELQKTVSLRRIRRIVYVHDDGSETMLWQLPASIENTQP